jgi:tetratricopeptide (TPR) repeat protein
MGIETIRALPAHIYTPVLCLCLALQAPSQDRSLDSLVQEGQNFELHGNFAEAERLYLEALRKVQREPSNPMSIAGVLLNLAAADTDQARYLDAEGLVLRALALTQKAAGPDSPVVACVLWRLIGVYADAGHLSQASPFLRRYEEIVLGNVASDPLVLAQNLGNLGRIYLLHNDPRKALALFQKALDIVDPPRAGNELLLVRALLDRAAAQGKLDHTGEAIADLDRAAAIAASVPDPSTQFQIVLQMTCGQVNSQAARWSEADTCFQSALQSAETYYGPAHPVVALVLNNYSAALRKSGRKKEASTYNNRANKIMKANQSPVPLGSAINAFIH